MSYFRNFPVVGYNFGNEIETTLFQNITAYVDLIDQVSDNATQYEYYEIMDNERPDALSYKLYGTSDYYWTFYLSNTKLRKQGWPISEQDLYLKGKEYYPNTVISTFEALSEIDNDTLNKFYVGDLIATRNEFDGPGLPAAPSNNPSFDRTRFKGTLIEKNLDLGQLIVKPIIEIRKITITDGGSGYTAAPTVEIIGGGGTGAKVQSVQLTNGVVTAITLSSKGQGYTATPTIKISEPTIASATSKKATAKAVLSTNDLPNGTTIYSFIGVSDTDLWGSDNKLKSLTAQTVQSNQLNAIHHYEDAVGNWVDLPVYGVGYGIDNTGTGTSGKTAITYLERLRIENNALRRIKIFKPEVINTIVTEFQKLLRR
jgi:hypothetical protein